MNIIIKCTNCDRAARFSDVELAYEYINKEFDEDVAEFLLTLILKKEVKKLELEMRCIRCRDF